MFLTQLKDTLHSLMLITAGGAIVGLLMAVKLHSYDNGYVSIPKLPINKLDKG